MKNLKRIKLSLLLAVLIFASGSLVAQTQQKLKKSYPMNANAIIKVDAQHTKLQFETWNKNEMEIEAFINTEGMSEEEITEALANWQVSVKGDKNSMSVQSTGGGFPKMPIPPRMDSIAMIASDIIGPIMNNLVAPMMANFPEHPLPPEFMENVGNLKFDHEAYKKDGEKYLQKWEKEMESKFGEDFEMKMEEWSHNFAKGAEQWGAKMDMKMSVMGENLEKDMEKWAEQFGSEMEAWGEKFGKDMEAWATEFEKAQASPKNEGGAFFNSGGNKTKKTMIIRIPKDAKLKLDVRYGEVKLPKNTADLKATISHSSLSGNTVSGKQTNVEVSYSPVKIKSWDYGVLNVKYVPNAILENVNSIKLTSASSNVEIGGIQESAVIAGTFGNLDIQKLSSDFKSVNISLENSELDMELPESDLNFNYSGSQSKIKYPSSIKAKPIKSYDSELINGYQGSAGGSGIVIIKASFSDVNID